MSICCVNEFYSGVCALGTKGCVTNHGKREQQARRIAELEAENNGLRDLIKSMGTGYDDDAIDSAMQAEDQK